MNAIVVDFLFVFPFKVKPITAWVTLSEKKARLADQRGQQ